MSINDYMIGSKETYIIKLNRAELNEIDYLIAIETKKIMNNSNSYSVTIAERQLTVLNNIKSKLHKQI